MDKMKNPFAIKDRNAFLFVLLSLIVYLLVLYNWVDTARTEQLSSTPYQLMRASYYHTTSNNAELNINNFDIDVSDLRKITVHLNFIITNNGINEINSTDMVFPWSYSDFPMVTDLKITSDGVYYSDTVSEFVYTSNETYIFPIQYQVNDSNYKIMRLALISNNSFSYTHGVGRIIRLHFDKPIKPNETKEVDLSFDFEGALFMQESRMGNFVDTMLPIPPINYYPLGEETLVFKILFPEFKTIDLNELYVNLPAGYSATDYRTITYTIGDLNRTVEPELQQGIVSFMLKKDFNRSNDCYDIKASIWQEIEQNGTINYTKQADGCVVKPTNIMDTPDILNSSFNWFLYSKNPAKTELALMRFSFNPTIHPIEENPSGLMIVANYRMMWWNFFIPILLMSLTIIISCIKFKPEDDVKKITLLIPFIIAIFAYWLPYFTKSPPMHPNLIDIGFLLTLFIALINMLPLRKLVIFRTIYPFGISFVIMLIGMFLGQYYPIAFDIAFYLAFIYPIVSYSFDYPIISIILSSVFVYSLSKNLAELKFMSVFFIRLIILSTFLPFVLDFVKKKIKLKYFYKFVPFYISFIFMWNIFYLILILMGTPNWSHSFWNYFLFLPIGVYLLLVLEEYIHNIIQGKDIVRIDDEKE